MKILVTGAAGFIGSHVAEALVARGDDVVGIDNFDPFYDPSIKERNLTRLTASPRFRLERADIRDFARMRAIAEGLRPQAIVHLAARAGVRPSIREPRLYCEVNLDGTMNLLEAARLAGADRFIFASSSSVYGERRDIPFRETDPVDHPISPYAATKKAGELLAFTHHHLFGFSVACLRFFTVYGPRQRPEMAIHAFAREIERGREITVYGDGTARRDFTFYEDIVAGVIASIDRARGYRIFNLGNNRTVELAEVIRLLEAALGKRARIRRLPDQPGDVPVTCAGVERARAELGYDPRTPIEEGIEVFVRWFREEAAERAP
ncbi:MAG: GDP-mannose 4,6-dehydratase [Planctomycetes bacterium]|nr:GDP-mannose 4,6-dehydratase [Planctomycetota bacterium]